MRLVERGLLLEEQKVLVVADLHIGYEFELSEAGVKIPSQTGGMKSRLIKMIREVKPEELIILGDFKHNIPYVGTWEYEELERFVRDLPVRVTMIRGNHDVDLQSILHSENVRFGDPRGEIRGSVGLFHGHVWPKRELFKCKYLVMGHTHPAVLLKESLGLETRLSCFVQSRPIWSKLIERYPGELGSYNPELKVIILPSFNKLLGGTALNVEEPLGPLARRCLDIPNSEIILEDGTILGTLRHIREAAGSHSGGEDPEKMERGL